MPANISNVNTDVGFVQAATLLNSVVQQATGKASATATRTEGFISQAQTLLKMGVDPVLNALSTVLSKTIFSIRPYAGKWLGLQRDSVQWGNHVRKISFGSGGVEDIEKYDLTDGQAIDMQKVKKPPVIQMNWYSRDSYQDHFTIFDDQLFGSLQSPEDWMRFVSGVTTEVSNKHNQYRENFARATMMNLIGSTANDGRVRHLLTEYATEYGIYVEDTTTPDPTAVLPTHLDSFVKWLFAQIKVLSDKMEQRSVLYHKSLDGIDLYRHTPKAMQRLYILSEFMAKVDAQVLSTVFNPSYLNIGQREDVAFWQSIESPDVVNVIPSQIYANGQYRDGDAYNGHVLGILMDWEAAGVTQINEYMAPAPHNVAGRYTTTWYSCEMRGYNDMSENAVVLALD